MILELCKDSIESGMSIAMERQKLWGLDLSSDAPVAAEALTSCFATYYALMHSLQDISASARSTGVSAIEKDSFHLFALHAGAVTGGKKLRGGNASTCYDVNFGSRKFSDYPMALDAIIQKISRDIAREKPARKMMQAADLLASIEKSVLEKAGRQNRMQDLEVELDEIVFKGLTYTTLESMKEKTAPREDGRCLTKPVIVGNEKAVGLIDNYCKILGLYDPAQQKNPFFHDAVNPRPLSVLLEGRPGCGKTLMIRYAEARLAEIAKEKSIGFNPVLVDNSFKDKWHGSDAQNLKRYFSQVKDQGSLSSISIDDAESIFPRRDSLDASFVEKGNVNSVLQFMNGLTTEYPGNYMILAATNCPDQMDPAIRERFSEKQAINGPTRPEHYISLFRIGLGKHFPDVSSSLGRFCYDKNLSGRNIDNVIKWAEQYVQNPGKINDTMMHQTYEQNCKDLTKMQRKLTEEMLSERLEKEVSANKERGYL